MEEKKYCPRCNNEKKIIVQRRCPKCKGHRRVVVPVGPDGFDTEPCDRCNQAGTIPLKVVCPACGDQPFGFDPAEVSRPDIIIRVLCPDCGEAYLLVTMGICTVCDGAGERNGVHCVNCQGRGKIPGLASCPNCHGPKKAIEVSDQPHAG